MHYVDIRYYDYSPWCIRLSILPYFDIDFDLDLEAFPSCFSSSVEIGISANNPKLNFIHESVSQILTVE